MNRVCMTGRLVTDPELKTLQGRNGSPFAAGTIRLAVSRGFRAKEGENRQDTDFWLCSVIGKTAEFVESYCKKGDMIEIEGQAHNDSYIDKDGNQKYIAKIAVTSLRSLEKKRTESSDGVVGEDGYASVPDIDDDELPFR